MGGVTIFNFNEFSRKMDKKILDWIHEDSNNRRQVCNRAFLFAISPILIYGVIGTLIITIIGIMR